jgi:predicted nucleic acid-binding protein
MRVLVDTCVWSSALRHRKPNHALESKLKELINDGRVVIIGPIRQELLSGISNEAYFKALKEHLSAFEDIPLVSDYFIKAAEFSNICRKKGVQGSTTDFLICAVACAENMAIFTTDSDFENYKKHIPIRLFH